MLSPSICYTSVLMTANPDVILTSVVKNLEIKELQIFLFSGLFLAFPLILSIYNISKLVPD